MNANQNERESDGRLSDDFAIVLDPDDVVTALRNRHEYERNGQEVITVRPPFDGEQRGEYRFSQSGNHWPPEMSPKPLDLSPRQFLTDDGHGRVDDIGYPTWSAVRAQLKDTEWEDDDEQERENYDEWAELWEHEVRAGLKDEIDINEFGHEAAERVPVRYESE